MTRKERPGESRRILHLFDFRRKPKDETSREAAIAAHPSNMPGSSIAPIMQLRSADENNEPEPA